MKLPITVFEPDGRNNRGSEVPRCMIKEFQSFLGRALIRIEEGKSFYPPPAQTRKTVGQKHKIKTEHWLHRPFLVHGRVAR